MCTVCGCGDAKVEGKHAHNHDHHHVHEHRHGDATHSHGHDHHHSHDHDHEHGHDHHHGDDHSHDDHHHHHGDDHSHDDHHHHHGDDHGHHHHHGEDLHYGKGAAGVHVAGMSQSKILQVEQDILGQNNAYAARNRARFAEDGIFALNLVSSPGSGKTTLLCKTIEALKGRVASAVIEGDQQTSFDADRIRETGVPAIQVNTGKGCHLDAHMVGHALEKLDVPAGGVLFIENVGNLVCPAAFDLGEAHKVAILSVTEGEDKPLKYPDMFAAADLMILSKTDLLPHLTFDVQKCLDFARRVNPKIELIQLSSTKGEGMEQWLTWIEAGRKQALAAKAAKLEAELAAVRRSIEGQ